MLSVLLAELYYCMFDLVLYNQSPADIKRL